MAHGEGVEGAGEEGGGLRGRKGEGPHLNLVLHQEAVEVVEHGRLAEEGEVLSPRLGEDGEQLLVQQPEEVPLPFQGEGGAAEDLPAQHQQGGAVDDLPVVAHPGHEASQHPPGSGVCLGGEGFQDLSQGVEGGPGRGHGGPSGQAVQQVQGLLKFPFRQQAEDGSGVGGDEPGDLVLAALQLPEQVDGDLVDLGHGEMGAEGQQLLPGVLPHRQVFAQGEEVGQVHGGVEGGLWVLLGVVGQQVHLYQFHQPGYGVF